MKYALEYTRQLGIRPTDNIEAGQSVLKAFLGWTAPDTLQISEFIVRLDGRGGVIICTSEDPAVVYSFVTQYTAWFDWKVQPVLDIADAAGPYGTGLAWAQSAIV